MTGNNALLHASGCVDTKYQERPLTALNNDTCTVIEFWYTVEPSGQFRPINHAVTALIVADDDAVAETNAEPVVKLTPCDDDMRLPEL